MPIPLIAGLALGAGSAIFNTMSNRKNATTQFNRQKELQQREMDFNAQQADLAYQRQHNENELAFQREKDWLLDERAYNEPMRQLERLRAAGINPATAYGNLTNSQTTPLDMSAASTSGASVGGSSAAMAAPSQLPELTSLMNGLKGLELANAQIAESQQRQQLLQAQTANVNEQTNKLSSYSPFWSEMAKYDVENKKYSARSIYRDILEKTWKYNNLFPMSLKKMAEEVNALSIKNDFDRQTFRDRMNEIIYGNTLKMAQVGGIKSQNAFRDFQATQMELTGSKIRQLYDQQINSIEFNQQLKAWEKRTIDDLSHGRIKESVYNLMMLNFLKQASSGSLFNLPNPLNWGADMETINKTIGALGFMM